MRYSLNSLERRVKALEARRGMTADGEPSEVVRDARAIRVHGEGLAGFYAWMATQECREQFAKSVTIIKTEGAPCPG